MQTPGDVRLARNAHEGTLQLRVMVTYSMKYMFD